MVADASSYMRLVMSDILNDSPDIVVVDTAQDGEDMLNKARLHDLDVIILDVEIPKNGRLSILKRMAEQNAAGLVLTGKEDKLKTAVLLEAIQNTAYQILIKPDGVLVPQMRAIAEELIEKVKQAAIKPAQITLQPVQEKATIIPQPVKANVVSALKSLNQRHKQQYTGKSPSHLVVIGASTGGAPAIEYILRNLPADFSAAILIAQHMPPGFSATFTRRLNSICELPVEEATPGAKIEAGHVIVATGEANLEVKTVMGSKANLCVTFSFEEYSLFDRPSVDLLMHSAAQVYEDKTIGIILSGLGKDGSLGLGCIHDKGGLTLAQDQDTSAIFGMPKSAIEEGVVDKVLPLTDIPRYLMQHIRQYEKIV
ncbi:MAG: chemotaxis protein CheB [Bacteroidia bacterium]